MAGWSCSVLIRLEMQTVSEIIQKTNYEVIYLKIDISQEDGSQNINLRADNFFLICFDSFCIPIRTRNASPLYRKLQELPRVKILRDVFCTRQMESKKIKPMHFH